MMNPLPLTLATANAKDGFRASKDGYIEASLDDCLISPFLITPSIVPLNTIFIDGFLPTTRLLVDDKSPFSAGYFASFSCA